MQKEETTKIQGEEDPPIDIYLPILQSIGAHLHLVDRNLRIQWANATGLKGTGRKLAEIKGRYCYEVHLGRSAPCGECPVKRVFDSQKPRTIERWVPLPDGSERCFEVRIYPVCDRRGILVYAIKIGFDVTRRRLAGEKAIQYVETLETSLRELINDSGSAHEVRDKENRFGLSRRETQVLHLMSQGLSNIEIARDLFISHHTVKTHVTHIFEKIGVTDRTQAAVLAARLGII